MPISSFISAHTDLPTLIVTSVIVLGGFAFNQSERTTVVETKVDMYAEDIAEVKAGILRLDEKIPDRK